MVLMGTFRSSELIIFGRSRKMRQVHRINNLRLRKINQKIGLNSSSEMFFGRSISFGRWLTGDFGVAGIMFVSYGTRSTSLRHLASGTHSIKFPAGRGAPSYQFGARVEVDGTQPYHFVGVTQGTPLSSRVRPSDGTQVIHHQVLQM